MDHDSWDLEAVVRGCRFPSPPAAAAGDPFSSFSPLLQEQEESLPVSFPELSETALYELEELCKPFIFKTVHHPPPPLPQQQQSHLDDLSSSSSAAAATIFATVAPPSPYQHQQCRQTHNPPPQISRSKRRKNQVKKVVCEVPVDGGASSPDPWAWRKYGQKPIKGSPYPRGYYRCSSSKGCPARKQVERSHADPSVLVITYTSEHNHPIPTHRSSLAGSTRSHKAAPSAQQPSEQHGLSPTTPLGASMEEEDELSVGDIELMGDVDDMLELDDGGGFDGIPFPTAWVLDGDAAASVGRRQLRTEVGPII